MIWYDMIWYIYILYIYIMDYNRYRQAVQYDTWVYNLWKIGYTPFLLPNVAILMGKLDMFFPWKSHGNDRARLGSFMMRSGVFFWGRDCEDWVGVNKTTYLNLVDDVDVTSVQDQPWSLKKELVSKGRIYQSSGYAKGYTYLSPFQFPRNVQLVARSQTWWGEGWAWNMEPSLEPCGIFWWMVWRA